MLDTTRCPVNFRTIHHTFQKWTRAGVFVRAYRSLLELYHRRRRPRYCCLDSSYVKSVYGRDCTGRNPTDRGRRATKLSAIVDDAGIPFALTFFTGNTSDYRTVDQTLADLLVRFEERIPMYTDKGYDSQAVRASLRGAGFLDQVSQRGVRTHPVLNRRRGVVERFFSWMDKYRRLILRYDSLVESYRAFTHLAVIQLIAGRLPRG